MILAPAFKYYLYKKRDNRICQEEKKPVGKR